MDLGVARLRKVGINNLHCAVHPHHGVVWTDGKSIYLAPIHVEGRQVQNATSVKLGEFENVTSVHWSSMTSGDSCHMCVVHQQNVTVWRVSGALPKLNFKQVRKINVRPVAQGCLWNPGNDVLCLLSRHQCSFYFRHDLNKGSYAFPALESGSIVCGCWSTDGAKLIICVGTVLLIYRWPDVSASLDDFAAAAWRIPGLEGKLTSIAPVLNDSVVVAAEVPLESLCKQQDLFKIPDAHGDGQKSSDSVIRPHKSTSPMDSLMNLQHNSEAISDSRSTLTVVHLSDRSRDPIKLSTVPLKGVLTPDILLYEKRSQCVVVGSNSQSQLHIYALLEKHLVHCGNIQLDKSQRPKGLCSMPTYTDDRGAALLILVGQRGAEDSGFLSSSLESEFKLSLKYVMLKAGSHHHSRHSHPAESTRDMSPGHRKSLSLMNTESATTQHVKTLSDPSAQSDSGRCELQMPFIISTGDTTKLAASPVRDSSLGSHHHSRHSHPAESTRDMSPGHRKSLSLMNTESATTQHVKTLSDPSAQSDSGRCELQMPFIISTGDTTKLAASPVRDSSLGSHHHSRHSHPAESTRDMSPGHRKSLSLMNTESATTQHVKTLSDPSAQSDSGRCELQMPFIISTGDTTKLAASPVRDSSLGSHHHSRHSHPAESTRDMSPGHRKSLSLMNTESATTQHVKTLSDPSAQSDSGRCELQMPFIISTGDTTKLAASPVRDSSLGSHHHSRHSHPAESTRDMSPGHRKSLSLMNTESATTQHVKTLSDPSAQSDSGRCELQMPFIISTGDTTKLAASPVRDSSLGSHHHSRHSHHAESTRDMSPGHRKSSSLMNTESATTQHVKTLSDPSAQSDSGRCELQMPFIISTGDTTKLAASPVRDSSLELEQLVTKPSADDNILKKQLIEDLSSDPAQEEHLQVDRISFSSKAPSFYNSKLTDSYQLEPTDKINVDQTHSLPNSIPEFLQGREVIEDAHMESQTLKSCTSVEEQLQTEQWRNLKSNFLSEVIKSTDFCQSERQDGDCENTTDVNNDHMQESLNHSLKLQNSNQVGMLAASTPVSSQAEKVTPLAHVECEIQPQTTSISPETDAVTAEDLSSSGIVLQTSSISSLNDGVHTLEDFSNSLTDSALQISSISSHTDSVYTSGDFSSLLTGRRPEVTSISSQTEDDSPVCFSSFSEPSIKASNLSTFSQTEQDLPTEVKAATKSISSQTETSSPVCLPNVQSVILETTDHSIQTEPDVSHNLNSPQFQMTSEASSACLHTAADSSEHSCSAPSDLQSVASERTDILDLNHTLKAHDLGHAKEDVLSDFGLGSSQHSLDSSWDALEKEARSQKDSIDALHRRLESLSSSVDKTSCVFPTKYQDMGKAEIIEIYCEKPEGTETKKFLLDNGRLQLEPIKLSFDLATVELWLDGIPCVTGANIDGYIPLRFSPSTRLHITGRPANKPPTLHAP